MQPGQPLSEHLDCSLRGRVGHQAGRHGTLAYARANHDDAAAALHVLQRCRGQTLSDCSTDTARAARNECNLSFEFLRQRQSLTSLHHKIDVLMHANDINPR
jgi:hypothetical protein